MPAPYESVSESFEDDSFDSNCVTWHCTACDLTLRCEGVETHYEKNQHSVFYTDNYWREVYCAACKAFTDSDLRKHWRLQRIITGLFNLKNTCFINSAVQLLTRTPLAAAFKHFFYFGGLEMVSPEERLVKAFAGLVTIIEAGVFEKVRPISFIERLREHSPMYQNKDQHDTQELIRLLLDTTQYVLKEPIVQDCFKGEFVTEVSCSGCPYRSQVVEPFYELNLQIASSSFGEERLSDLDQRVIKRVNSSFMNTIIPKKLITVYDCLKSFFVVETLEPSNSDCCRKVAQLTRSPSIRTFPKFLTIVLKRFKYGWWSSKDSSYVHYPAFLILPGGSRYELAGLIKHSGPFISRGHYRACVKVAGDWYEADDLKQRRMNLEEVLGNEAYVLLYANLET